jgi:CheY-like chemotaxis protein
MGAGSTFWIELQLAAQDAVGRMRIVEEHPIDYREGRTATVLYIEDNLSNVHLMERILARRPSLTLETAASGQDGLVRARARRPDVVLLDLHLPDVPGEEVLGRMKGDADLTDVPVIVLSADATPGQVKRLLASGAVAHLTKPLAIPEVLGAIDRVVQACPGAVDTVQEQERHA